MNLDIFDDVKTYLPKYLSEEQRKSLFDELSQFPLNLDSRVFSDHMLDSKFLHQGDSFKEISIADYSMKNFKRCKALMISNSCDVSIENSRIYDSYISFVPIFSLERYKTLLISSGHETQRVNVHIESIRKQRVTSFFYLPNHSNLTEESFARFDCCFSFMLNQELENELIDNRLTVLSDYGFYMLLLKLSIHSSRIQEAISRTA